jgi:hypothetical protein
MKAVRFNQYGAVDVLEVVDAPVPEPGQGEALINVKAVSINPGEAKIREGLLHARWPARNAGRQRVKPSARARARGSCTTGAAMGARSNRALSKLAIGGAELDKLASARSASAAAAAATKAALIGSTG